MQDEEDGSEGVGRRNGKSDTAFRTISEVSSELGVPQHVLRFWETKFSQIRPMKRGGGRRYYRPEDVVLLGTIRDLLYTDGYTIKGAQKLLRENGVKAVITMNTEARDAGRSVGTSMGPQGSSGQGLDAEDQAIEAEAEPPRLDLSQQAGTVAASDESRARGSLDKDPDPHEDGDDGYVSFSGADVQEDFLDTETNEDGPLFQDIFRSVENRERQDRGEAPQNDSPEVVSISQSTADRARADALYEAAPIEPETTDPIPETGDAETDPLAAARERVDVRLSFDQRRECELVLGELMDLKRILSQAGLE